MKIIDYKVKGETFYTHQTWLSTRQRRAWYNIPEQNKNLAFYYTLSTLAVVAIGYRKIPLAPTYFKQLGFYVGTAALTAGAWLGWSMILGGKTDSQLRSVLQTNDCLYTPFWKTQQSVINLKEKSLKDNFAANRYVNRGRGLYSRKDQIQKFSPDLILEHPKAQQLLQGGQ